MKPTARRIVLVGLALIWGYGIYTLFMDGEKQWDFKTYYYAALAHAQGHVDWQGASALSEVAESQVKLGYVYPPLSVWFFRAFTMFDFAVAGQLWLILKIVLLVALIVVWSKGFLVEEDPALIILFTTFAFGSAAYWDLIAGNISIVEQFILWSSLWCFLKKQYWIFTACVIILSFFKLTFIVFLLLPVLVIRSPGVKYLLSGVACFVAYLILNYALYQGEFYHFWSTIGSLDERGEAYNHSLLAFSRDLTDIISLSFRDQALTPEFGYSVYLLAALACLGVAGKLYRKAVRMAGAPAPLDTVVLFTLTYALAQPRMKIYSCLLLILPSLYVIRRAPNPLTFVLLVIILSLTRWSPLPFPDATRLLWWYYPWLTALLVWALHLVYINRRELAPGINI